MFGHVELLVHTCSVMIITVATVSTWVTNGGSTRNCGVRMDTAWLAAHPTVMMMMMMMMMTHLSTGTRTGHAVPTVTMRTVPTSETVIAVTL